MRVPIKWIRDFVDIDIPVEDLADKLTMSGTKTELIIDNSKNIENVVVGKILEINTHPNADKLVITKIDIGMEEKLQIVTGAKNVSVGDIVPVALDNSTLPQKEAPFYKKIKKGEFRGELSDGMLCSASELGIEEKYIEDRSKNGIWILDDSLTIGEDIKTALDLQDYILEFEITSNRPDCLSMIGIAHEVSAVLDKKINLPSNEYKSIDKDFIFDAKVEDDTLCPRYILKKVIDIKIEKSPYYIQRRLIEAGVRPINNIVDITNYVMLEYGQPMHAFDAEFLSKNKIVVKKANNGEKFITLDNQERTLDENMLMITDGEENIAIAGVMGGLNSEITDDTKSVIFESANFDSDSVRLTSKKLNLKTDSSIRFEKGIDIKRAKKAIDKACYLVEKYGWGKVLNSEVDICNDKKMNNIINISLDEIQKSVGIDISSEQINDILERLFFTFEEKDGNYAITPPSFRLDVFLKADIVEEITRLYGYEKITSKNMVSQVTYADKSASKRFEEKTKDILVSVGLSEVITYSFIGEKDLNKINFPIENVVKVLNPLGEDTSIMRTTLLSSMLNVVSRNYNRKNEHFAGFEVGNIFREDTGKNQPIQKKEIVSAIYGQNVTFFTMKEKLESYLSTINIKNREYIPYNLNDFFHPTRCAVVTSSNNELGYIGQVNPLILEKYDINTPVFIFVLDFDILLEISDLSYTFIPVSKFPSIKRDISFVVDKKISIREIEKAIKNVKCNFIDKIELFDIYEGEQVGESKKSISYSITYQNSDRTLQDKEVNEIQEKILKSLEDNVKAILREK